MQDKNSHTGEVTAYVKGLKKKISIEKIKKILNKLAELNVMIIGDIIIDQYVFTTQKGRAIKDPILSVEYNYHETYAGGVLAIANHIADFVKNITLVTLIGDKSPRISFIRSALKNNVELNEFVKKDSYTTVKKRYIDTHRNNKLFKIEYMNDKPITSELTKEIVSFLKKEIPKHNLVIVGDFGHGFINQQIRQVLEKQSKFLATNVQSNSANMGYNYINLYKKPDFITMSEEELRLPLSMRFDDINKVMSKGCSELKLNQFIVTLGKRGCAYVKNGKIFKAPAFTTAVKDTVGAGDALFAISSLLAYAEADNEIIPFIANCAGGVKVQYMGNKESVTKEKLLGFVKGVYEDEVGCI